MKSEHSDPSPEGEEADHTDRSLEDRFQDCREVQAEHATLPLDMSLLAREHPGNSGPYRILEVLGEGGIQYQRAPQ